MSLKNLVRWAWMFSTDSQYFSLSSVFKRGNKKSQWEPGQDCRGAGGTLWYCSGPESQRQWRQGALSWWSIIEPLMSPLTRPAFQSLEHSWVRGCIDSLSWRYKLKMNDSSDVKEDNEYCSDERLAHARFFGADGRSRVPLEALPLRFGIVFEYPGFISGYERVKEGRIFYTQLQQFVRAQNWKFFLFVHRHLRHKLRTDLSHLQIFGHYPMYRRYWHVQGVINFLDAQLTVWTQNFAHTLHFVVGPGRCWASRTGLVGDLISALLERLLIDGCVCKDAETYQSFLMMS